MSQTDLYSAYAARFSTLLPETDESAENDAELKEFEANMAAEDEMDDINSFLPPAPESEAGHESAEETSTPRENRLLNPVELISLVRMTFPKSEAAVDDQGRFVLRGLERREGVEKGRTARSTDMFPFAVAAQPHPSDPAHPFTSLLKRKLALLAPEPDEPEPKRRATSIGVNIPMGEAAEEELSAEDRELVDGLARFRDSKLGKEVRDVCVQQ